MTYPVSQSITSTLTFTPSMAARDLSRLAERAWSPEDDAEILRALGEDFDAIEPMSRGGTAHIYRAAERISGESVAIKIPRPLLRRTASGIELFASEARFATKLRSPSTVEFWGVCETAGIPTLVFEWLERGDLGALVQSGVAGGLAARLHWVLGATSALEQVHGARVIHADVSPRNFLLTDDGRVKIGDFGAARFLDVSTGSASARDRVLGTFGFVAPELLDGDESSVRSDLYGLGATSFFLLAGRHAIPCADFAEFRRAHDERSVPRLRDVVPDAPARLDDLLARLLATHPLERPRDASVVRREIAAILREVE